MRPLRQAEHRVLSVALLLAIIVVMYMTIIAPFFVDPATSVSDQMQDLEDTASRYQTLLGQRSALQQASIRLADANQRDPVVLPGSDAAQVSADLVDRLGALVAAHQDEGAGCDVEDKTPIVGEQSRTVFPEVKVNLSLACSIEPLAKVLSDIEHSKPYLFIESMSVARSDDAPLKGPAGKLHVQLTVAAYMHPVPTKPAEKTSASGASNTASASRASGNTTDSKAENASN